MKNKSIWMYWHQGFENAPFVVTRCVEQWRLLHPDWQINLLDKNNIATYVDPLPIVKTTLDKMSLPHQSDLIRTQLLIKYGGVWADPTCFPLQKLDFWLLEKMSAGVFFYFKPGRDRIMSNWFIASEPDNKLLVTLFQEMIKYWNATTFKNLGSQDSIFIKNLKRVINRNLWLPLLWCSPLFNKLLRTNTYFIYHYMVFKLVTFNKICREIFKQMPKIEPSEEHKMIEMGLLAALNDNIKKIIDNKSVPLFKLNWKIKNENIPSDSNLYYLFNNSRNHDNTK